MALLKQIRIIFLFVLICFFSACSFSSNSIKSIAQTNSASQVEEHKDELIRLLLLYKKKLDIRNPNAYNKNLSYEINNQIQNQKNYVNIKYGAKRLTKYNEYLHYAFLKSKIQNRDDFLILGLYKLIYKAFNLDSSHKFLASQYSTEDMSNLYKYLQIIRWKVRTSKDDKGIYLFKTWQNNWQLELANKNLTNLNIIKDLKYIKHRKESIFDHSNFSFEILISEMLTNVKFVLKQINVEPFELGVNALTSFIFLL